MAWSLAEIERQRRLGPVNAQVQSPQWLRWSYRIGSISSGPTPVMQANEPTPTKHHDLNTLVRNWRSTTPAVPALPREEGTTKDTLESPDFALDLDYLQWSISSAGAAWYPDNNVSVYACSVDLEARLEGLAALAPSLATSFGPDHVHTPAFSNVEVPIA